uniref:Uncharacterized protein n=1 Tax=Anguilla anguilla TaxID=7936 RepID=A0A0E9SG48_ANGAN
MWNNFSQSVAFTPSGTWILCEMIWRHQATVFFFHCRLSRSACF